jgi:hypothetical protein
MANKDKNSESSRFNPETGDQFINSGDNKTVNHKDSGSFIVLIKKNIVLRILVIAGAIAIVASIIWGIVIMNSTGRTDDASSTQSGTSLGMNSDMSDSSASVQGDSTTDGSLVNGSIVSGSNGNGSNPNTSTLNSESRYTSRSAASTAITPAVKSVNLSVWYAPEGTKQNNSYSVYVRETGKQSWVHLFVYSPKIGHQEGNDPLRALVGMEYYGPVETSMVNFDFNGKVDMKIVYQKSTLNSYKITPEAYNITSKKEVNTIYFTIEQNSKAPRKIVLRPNGDWEKNVLHIMTNPMETSAPKTTDSNVYVINPGSEIPRVLPEGKSVYYFKPGNHTLPRGSWVDFDFGKAITINKFDFITGVEKPFYVPGPQDFRIEYKLKASDSYKMLYETNNNSQMNLTGISFTPVKAQYIRLILKGNNATKTGSGYNYLNSNNVKEFRIFEKDTTNNVLLGKAIEGSPANYPAISDGSDSSLSYVGHMYSSESFFIARDGYTMYLAPGAIVKGAINSDWKSGIKIKGRGILDCSELVHDPAGKYAEGRTSAIRSEYSDNILIDGITVLDSPMWGIITNQSSNPIVRNMNFFGSIVNSDGVHMSGVTNGLVEGCFIRTTDDAFVMYHYGPADGVIVRNSVFLSDGGRIVLIGMATSKGDIRNVTFENNDILNVQNVWDMYKHGGAFSLWASGGNTIENIMFRNIRIEAFREPRIASLFQIKTIADSGWSSGKINGVTFDNILYKGSGEAVSYALGDGAQYDVKNLVFKNFRYGDKVLTSSDHPNIEIRNFVNGVTFSK